MIHLSEFPPKWLATIKNKLNLKYDLNVEKLYEQESKKSLKYREIISTRASKHYPGVENWKSLTDVFLYIVFDNQNFFIPDKMPKHPVQLEKFIHEIRMGFDNIDELIALIGNKKDQFEIFCYSNLSPHPKEGMIVKSYIENQRRAEASVEIANDAVKLKKLLIDKTNELEDARNQLVKQDSVFQTLNLQNQESTKLCKQYSSELNTARLEIDSLKQQLIVAEKNISEAEIEFKALKDTVAKFEKSQPTQSVDKVAEDTKATNVSFQSQSTLVMVNEPPKSVENSVTVITNETKPIEIINTSNATSITTGSIFKSTSPATNEVAMQGGTLENTSIDKAPFSPETERRMKLVMNV